MSQPELQQTHQAAALLQQVLDRLNTLPVPADELEAGLYHDSLFSLTEGADGLANLLARYSGLEMVLNRESRYWPDGTGGSLDITSF